MTQAFNLSQLANKVNTSGELDATTGLDGTLPIANGGTNNPALAVTAGGALYTDGSKVMNAGAGLPGQVYTSQGSGAPIWDFPQDGFSNLQVFTTSGTFTVPVGVTKLKVTVVGGGGGGSAGGTTSFGALCSATGGEARLQSENLNNGGTGSSGDVNVSGCAGGFSVGINQGSTSQSRTMNAAGGMSAFGLGRGDNYTRSTSVSGSSQAFSRGGAGGGGAMGIYTVTPSSSISATVGASGGGNATAGIIIVEY